jgi:hypothetical protein
VIVRVAILAALGLTPTAVPGSAESTTAERCRGADGATLCIPLASGWYGSVGFGYVRRESAAWLLAGNFRISRDAATRKGLPDVPRGRILIALGEFPIEEHSTRWARVTRLSVPQRTESKTVKRDVRFAGRAVRLTVRFGSRPTATTRSLVNEVLARVHRVR